MDNTVYYRTVDNIIKDVINLNYEVYLFGVGDMAVELLNNSKISFGKEIFDNSINKCEKIFLNDYIVKSSEYIEQIVSKFDNIIISSNSDNDIAEQLKKLGYCNIFSLPQIFVECEARLSLNHNRIKVCMIESTNLCNARCEFCVNSTMKRKKMHMTEAIFDKIIERLVDENISPSVFRLHCVGEPLLDPNLFIKISKLKNIFPNAKVGFTTNFSVADDTIISKIYENKLDYLTISLNSINGKEYQRIMGINYNQTISNIENLLLRNDKIKSNMEISISAVVNEIDSKEAIRFKESFISKNVGVRLMKKGNWINNYCDDDDNDIIEYKHCLCPWLYKEICILSDGTYGLCCFDAESILGGINVNNTSLMEAMRCDIKTEMRKRIVKGYSTPQMCRECSFS